MCAQPRETVCPQKLVSRKTSKARWWENLTISSQRGCTQKATPSSLICSRSSKSGRRSFTKGGGFQTMKMVGLEEALALLKVDKGNISKKADIAAQLQSSTPEGSYMEYMLKKQGLDGLLSDETDAMKFWAEREEEMARRDDMQVDESSTEARRDDMQVDGSITEAQGGPVRRGCAGTSGGLSAATPGGSS